MVLPASNLQQRRDSPVAVAPVGTGQRHDRCGQRLFHPFRLIQLQAAELFPPAVVRLNVISASLQAWGYSSRSLSHFNLPQQRHDLLLPVFLHRHVQLSFRLIFSHSCWTNSSRSRQPSLP
jgi:hypothetical protein